MGTGTVYEELDEAKSEIEQLKANYQIKVELSENLKRAHSEQLTKYQEAVLKVDKLTKEVNEKSAVLEEAQAENKKLRENFQMKVEISESLRRAHGDLQIKNQEASLKIENLSQELQGKMEEISTTRQMYQKLESNLKEKESLVKHLSVLNDKLKAESREKIEKYEAENLRLGLALEEASAKGVQQDQLMQSLQEEIARLKEIASVSKTSSSEADRNSKSLKEMRQRDDVLQKYEEENNKYENQFKWKKEQFNHLQAAHNELLTKNQEARLKIEKLSQELDEKNEETSVARKMYEELKLRLKEKDTAVKHLTALNDKIHAESKEKIKKCEEDNSRLGSALDEAITKNMQQEELMQSLREEIHRFRGHALNNSSSEANRNRTSLKEGRQRDDLLQKYEEEKNKCENQLKWKKEQFNHLQEAHEKLRSDFQVKEREWGTEKAILLDELSNLQAKLESQIRISETLKSRLEMCNHALSHAESKRKFLEVELSESRSNFDNVFTEYEAAKSTIENLTSQRDEEIASLRCSLVKKETLYKELEYQVRMLEQEKSDLTSSLKELQETQIQEVGHASSLAKLRNKFKGLEQVHKECSEKLKAKESDWNSQMDSKTQVIDRLEAEAKESSERLKAKESDWNSQMETLLKKLNSCRIELDSKTQLIDRLETEAKAHDSMIIQLGLLSEEAAIVLLVLKSEFSAANLKLADACIVELDQNREHKERLSVFMKELEAKNIALIEAQRNVEAERTRVAQRNVEAERTRVAELAEKVQSTKLTEERELSLLKETNRLRQELSESRACESEAKKQNLTLENSLNEVCNTLWRTNEELDMKLREGTELDFELQIWKYIAQELKTNLEEDSRKHREAETSLHFQMLSLKNHVKKLCDAMDKAKEELAEKFCEGNEIEFQLQTWKSVAEQLSGKLEDNHHLRKEVEASLLAQVGLEVNLKQEKVNLLTLIEEKDRRIDGLEQQLVSLSKEMEKREKSTGPVTSENTMCDRLEQENSPQYAKAKLEDSQKEEEWVKRELEGAIFVQVDAERNHEHEKETLQQQVEERDQRIENLQHTVRSLEQEFESSMSSFSSKLSDMQSEIYSLRQAWDKVAESVFLKELEVQEKNLIVLEMEKDCRSLALALQACKAELENITHKLSSSDVLIEKLKAEKGCILEESLKLSSDRNILLQMIGDLSERLRQLSEEDMHLVESLGCIMQTFNHEEPELDVKLMDDLFDPLKENRNSRSSSASSLKADAVLDQRLPLRAINN